MSNTNLSFYLSVYRIHVFVDTLRGIGSPSFICFLVGNDGTYLAMAPYGKKDFHSHRISKKIYEGRKGLEISSLPLCSLLAKRHNWDMRLSYRVPGTILKENHVALFDLSKAQIIEHLPQTENKHPAPLDSSHI